MEIYNITPSSGRVEKNSETTTTVKGKLVGREGGDHTLTVYLTAKYKNFGYKEVKYSYSCKPESPSCKLTVVNNVATLNVNVSVRFGRNKGYGGLGKAVSKKVTIR